ncbi:MAG TPA: hypothetical protein DCW94_07120 [Porticoccaceae bacterium]|nr:hypothetical protein [Porticoccaceae bacterium]
MPELSKKEQHKTNSGILSAYKTHVDALRRFISRFVGKHDVEGVVQEAFLLNTHHPQTSTPHPQALRLL